MSIQSTYQNDCGTVSTVPPLGTVVLSAITQTTRSLYEYNRYTYRQFHVITTFVLLLINGEGSQEPHAGEHQGSAAFAHGARSCSVREVIPQ